MDLKTAIQYVAKYRNNGRSCYVHAANRGTVTFATPRGNLVFRCHAQSNGSGRSKTKYCAYLIWEASGKPCRTREARIIADNAAAVVA